ncbi:hypothetical protein HU200_018605 [Digitaria exilis]|uniref:Uncharacterized protein n=1 Tax=Digitaria exilis TaxID=1010633 RepID=A0A835F4E9_9POAL|nr:hypothetical protein HU200_018605 [Digitaria exilis]
MGSFPSKGRFGFSPSSTAEEVTAGVDGRGLVAIITGQKRSSAHRQKRDSSVWLRMSHYHFGAGASSGIGLETARVLALRGVHVVMAVRNVPAGRSAREGIVSKIPGARVNVLELDLSSMASVRRFASEFDALNLPLNILINNAGVLTKHVTRSHDGLELHFATNHIGAPFSSAPVLDLI